MSTDWRSRHSNNVQRRSFWASDDRALALINANGGPFEREAFRSAVVDAMPGSRDVSFGAVAPDGTSAAIALIGQGHIADSVPPSGYGGIQSSRALTAEEERTFLQAARRGAGSLSLTTRALHLDSSQSRRKFATASVVRSQGHPAYSRLARRSLRKAERAGASAMRSSDPSPFFSLYRAASTQWVFRYPERLVELLAARGAATFHHVELNGEVVSSLFTLVDGSHWMCWLAAQSERGRSVAASYVAYDALFEAARTSVELVNLGASAPGSGGAEFKSHLGAVEVPMVAAGDSVPGLSAARSAVAPLRRLRSRFS
jgi:hypothetical protein